jgi:glycosyltransferase involved in cell wall biosynthesis
MIIDHFSQTPDEKGNNRFIYLADRLVNSGYDVELVTTDFSHKEKKTRKINKTLLAKLPYKYTMLKEPGYPKNVCLKRFYSHYIFGENLKKYMATVEKPDLVYVAVPSLDAGLVAAKYCEKKGVPLIVDIQDLWPEAFKLVFNVPFISNIFFNPLKKIADRIYSSADKIIAVSQTYLRRGIQVNSKDKEGLCIFLGTDLNVFDEAFTKNRITKPEDEIWIIYIGTLGHSYNINIISDALSEIYEKGYKNVVFKVLGDGPLMNDFKKYADKLGIRADFLGRMHYEEMIGFLAKSDIAVNPIVKGAAQSIINKHGDYAAAGLPVVNTQENIEYKKLLDEYKCGINCGVDDKNAVANAIIYLLDNHDIRKKMGKASRLVAERYFNRDRTYMSIIKQIDEMVKEN